MVLDAPSEWDGGGKEEKESEEAPSTEGVAKEEDDERSGKGEDALRPATKPVSIMAKKEEEKEDQEKQSERDANGSTPKAVQVAPSSCSCLALSSRCPRLMIASAVAGCLRERGQHARGGRAV